jgi:predicted protein tyrosine phosphatase
LITADKCVTLGGIDVEEDADTSSVSSAGSHTNNQFMYTGKLVESTHLLVHCMF